MLSSRLASSRKPIGGYGVPVLLAAVLIRQGHAQIAGMMWGHSTCDTSSVSLSMNDRREVLQLRVIPRSDLMRAKTTICRLSMSSISTPVFWESASSCN